MNKKYAIQEVFDMIGEDYLQRDTDHDKNKSDIEVDGYQVHPISLRYMTFYQKGTKCVCCGKEGAYFQLDPDRYGTNADFRRHFNLYAEDGTLMTKDHIIPKSKGGLNKVSNMQTMCAPCNKAKSAVCPGHEREYIVGTAANGKEVCFTTFEKAAYHIAMNNCNCQAKKVSKAEAVKSAISCAIHLKSALENNTVYANRIWKIEMR